MFAGAVGNFAVDSAGLAIVVADRRVGLFKGTDTITSVETLRFAGVDYEVQVGTATINTITGNANRRAIFGFGGNDALNGAGGDDIVPGGDGNDRILGAMRPQDSFNVEGFNAEGGAGSRAPIPPAANEGADAGGWSMWWGGGFAESLMDGRFGDQRLRLLRQDEGDAMIDGGGFDGGGRMFSPFKAAAAIKAALHARTDRMFAMDMLDPVGFLHMREPMIDHPAAVF